MKRLELIEGEEWKPIPGFDIYQASNLGRFKRVAPTGVFEIEGKVDRIGYRQVGLQKDGKQHWKLAHRVIASVFIGADELRAEDGQFLTVNHKDRNKLNNRMDNLELVSVAQNHQHWRKHPLHSAA